MCVTPISTSLQTPKQIRRRNQQQQQTDQMVPWLRNLDQAASFESHYLPSKQLYLVAMCCPRVFAGIFAGSDRRTCEDVRLHESVHALLRVSSCQASKTGSDVRIQCRARFGCLYLLFHARSRKY